MPKSPLQLSDETAWIERAFGVQGLFQALHQGKGGGKWVPQGKPFLAAKGQGSVDRACCCRCFGSDVFRCAGA
ncbi:MAG: hypothetical protein V4671_16520, partial [Armatimonadota bacterium]